MQSFISRLYANKSQKFDYRMKTAQDHQRIDGGSFLVDPAVIAGRFGVSIYAKGDEIVRTHSAGLHLGMSTGFDSGSSRIMSIKINRKAVTHSGALSTNLPEQCWLARYSPAQNPFTKLIKQAVADLHAKGLAVRVVALPQGMGAMYWMRWQTSPP